LRADRKNFERAQQELKQRGIAFHFEDHGIAHSIYFRDPDGHELEITTYEVEQFRVGHVFRGLAHAFRSHELFQSCRRLAARMAALQICLTKIRRRG
jgi:catechol-2,3-dioxygenase